MARAKLYQSVASLRECLRPLLSIDGTISAFAYGSGVYPQKVQGEMVDLLLIVKNARDWHRSNLQKHKSHYSSLAMLGADCVSAIGAIGPGVYFNPNIHLGGLQIKYGVISIKHFLHDLQTWKWLYLAGRLHKPTLSLLPLSSELSNAMSYNTRAALAAAILTIHPDQTSDGRFTPIQLYTQISQLSYKGDLRFILGAEHPNKIDNIVQNNVHHFDQLYADALRSLKQHIHVENHHDRYCIICPPSLRATLLDYLPPDLRNFKLIQSQLKRRVFFSSLVQTCKGILQRVQQKLLVRGI